MSDSAPLLLPAAVTTTSRHMANYSVSVVTQEANNNNNNNNNKEDDGPNWNRIVGGLVAMVAGAVYIATNDEEAFDDPNHPNHSEARFNMYLGLTAMAGGIATLAWGS